MKMIIIQITLIAATTGLLLFTLGKFLSKFQRKDILPHLLIPLFLFSIGFILRLLPLKAAVDIGFFFTGVSSIFLYIILVMAILLGQIKYWKK